jgi:hypothetical protein
MMGGGVYGVAVEAQSSLIIDSHTCLVEGTNGNDCMPNRRDITSLQNQGAERRLVEIWDDLEDSLVAEQREVLKFVLVVEGVGVWEV